MGKGGKGKGGGYHVDTGDAGGASHYFGESAEDKEQAERRKQEMKWKKKLREVEDLEKRRDAGEKIEALQQKKIDNKQSILDELAKCTSPPTKPAHSLDQDEDEKQEDEIGKVDDIEKVEKVDEMNAFDMDDVKRELEMMEEESRELEQMERQAAAKAKAAKEAAKSRGKGARGADPKAPPSVSMRAQQRASAPAGKVEKRQALPQATDEQKKQFKDDLVQWSGKFGCQYKFMGAELAVLLDPPIADEAMAELQGIMAYDLGA